MHWWWCSDSRGFCGCGSIGLMCRDTLSVDWKGRLYDYDFNQMLGLKLGGQPEAAYLWEAVPEHLEGRPIATGDHCLACSAGAGSSCGGALA